jgi:hypothetical protein
MKADCRTLRAQSIAITANAPFSTWDEVFPDKAMTLAAVDRLVHHATILEMNVESYRRKAAARPGRAQDARQEPKPKSVRGDSHPIPRQNG